MRRPVRDEHRNDLPVALMGLPDEVIGRIVVAVEVVVVEIPVLQHGRVASPKRPAIHDTAWRRREPVRLITRKRRKADSGRAITLVEAVTGNQRAGHTRWGWSGGQARCIWRGGHQRPRIRTGL